ncbi:unnamed protein product [Symbiodinium natans]|uniref:Uncharacterized protein n=1 Tax=Symbiodinium natans TaxID=878477 RepID=A0A812HN30_9DINO|nr:unnamed protein product [Symbiodinium natans]
MARPPAKLGIFGVTALNAAGWQFLSSGDAHTQETANLARAFGNLHARSSMLMLRASQESQDRASELLPQEPANLSWTSGKLYAEEGSLLAATRSASLEKASQSGPQNPSNTARGLATSAVLGRLLTQMISQQGASVLDQLDAQDASNLARAPGTLDLSELSSTGGLPEACCSRVLTEPSTQNAANALRGPGTMGRRSASPMRLEHVGSLCHLKYLSCIGWDPFLLRGTTLHFGTQLMDAVMSSFLHDKYSHDEQGLANIAWELAQLAMRCEALFEGAAQACVSRIQGFDGQQPANTAWGLAHVLVLQAALRDAACQQLSGLLGSSDLTAQSCADLHWALGVLQADDNLRESLRSHGRPALEDLASSLRDVGLSAASTAQYQQTAFKHQVLNMRAFTGERPRPLHTGSRSSSPSSASQGLPRPSACEPGGRWRAASGVSSLGESSPTWSTPQPRRVSLTHCASGAGRSSTSRVCKETVACPRRNSMRCGSHTADE